MAHPPRAALAALTAASLRHPWRFLLGALVIAGACAYLASGLAIRSSFEELLPTDVPSVREIKTLLRRVGGEGTVFVLVEALDGPRGLPAAEKLARELANDYRALGPAVIRSAETDITPVARWYEDHWPLFLSVEELTRARDELRRAIGEAKSKALFGLGLDDAAGAPALSPQALRENPLLDPSRPLPREEVARRFARFRDGFMVDASRRAALIVVRPAGTSLAVEQARALLGRMRDVAARRAPEAREHRLRVGFAGSFPFLIAEYEAIVKDVFTTFSLCLSIILLSLVIFYRDLRSTLALGVAVLGAVAVTFGLTRLVIGYLNTMTAFLGVMVAGNGINYGLIYLARVSQLRRLGTPLPDAVQDGAKVAARATLLASLATSVSFGTLIVAANRGFRHFGFIGGIGMVLCWAFTFALVPALLVAFERIRPFRPRTRYLGRWKESWLRRLFAWPRITVALFAVLAAASVAGFLHRLPDVMELNLENLTNEVEGNPTLRRDQALANSALGKSSSSVLALLPDRETADGYCDAIRERQKDPRWKDLIEGCETVSSVVPRRQREKLEVIRDVVARLTPAVLSRLPAEEGRRARILRGQLAAQRPLSFGDAPPPLLDRFRERDGTMGRIAVVTARPGAHIERGPNLRAFAAAVRGVEVGGRKYDAAGETVIFADLLSNIQHEGPVTTLLSFLGVCLLVLVFTRSTRGSALVLVSLAVGVILMGGAATALDLKINFFNFIVYPITFGIAVDYGANVLARMRARGDVLLALSEVGPAVALCSWTTIVGYASLLFSVNRALRSFGWYGIAGEVSCILAALVLLPALLLGGSGTGHISPAAPAREKERQRGEAAVAVGEGKSG